jgi:hypothetical protein
MIAYVFSACPAPFLILGLRDRALVFFDELSRDQYSCNPCAWNLAFGITFSEGRVRPTNYLAGADIFWHASATGTWEP